MPDGHPAAAARPGRARDMKGILLAGGAGTRLHPMTRAVSKQLLAVYDKPMVYYPLSTLMMAGIREILLISTPRDLPAYRDLLGDGQHLGVRLRYAEQARPAGLPHAFLIGREFVGDSDVTLILGDNIFFGHGLGVSLGDAARTNPGMTIFCYPVRDPSRYGVAELDGDGRLVGVEEKPRHPRSRNAITGLYICDNAVLEVAAGLRPSDRGETEIGDVIRDYLRRDAVRTVLLGRGTAWLDTGTADALLDAANFVHAVQERQGLSIACVEEVAYRMGYIDLAQLERLAGQHGASRYGRYLRDLVRSEAGIPPERGRAP